jgi:hypothetical protein
VAKTIAKYRTNADECRALARDTSLTQEQRQRLLDMAKTWEALADDREEALRASSSRPEPGKAD